MEVHEPAPGGPPGEKKSPGRSFDPDKPEKVKTVSLTVTKKKKMIIVIGIVAALFLFLIWSFIPEKFYEVSDIAENPDKFLGDNIQLTGPVAGGTLDMKNNTFSLTDGTSNLTIIAKSSLPDTIREGKDVMLKGELKKYDGSTGDGLENYYFEAREVKVGCPSKYY